MLIGERIVPLDAGRFPSSSFGAGVDEAVAMGQYRKDRVFIFDSEGLPPESHLDRWTFTPRQVARIYEVEPTGGIEPDPDRTALPTWRCCPGAVVLRRVWPVMTSEEELKQRMTALLRSAKLGHSPIPMIDHGLSSYVPAVPGWIYFLDTLDEHETLLAKVHELTHASLHPPGAEDYDEANYLDVEERSAHEAASRVCAQFGVEDYLPTMSKRGISADFLQAGDPETVEVMAERVAAALGSPHEFPEWATVVEKMKWKRANDETTSCLLTMTANGAPLPRRADAVRVVYRELDA